VRLLSLKIAQNCSVRHHQSFCQVAWHLLISTLLVGQESKGFWYNTERSCQAPENQQWDEEARLVGGLFG